ncbi:MAG: DUF1707 SHOCT-like domain-containing protein [Jiangellaceae bacterium]
MSTVPHTRIGDAERDRAATALGEHFAAGRLTKAEFDERVTQVWSARFNADLVPLLADLPQPSRPRPAAQERPGPRPWPRPHPLMFAVPLLWLAPVLTVALITVVIVAGAPWLLFALFWFCAFSGPRRQGLRHRARAGWSGQRAW